MPSLEYKEKLSNEVEKIYLLEVTRFSELFSQWRWSEHEKTEGFERIPVESTHSQGVYISDFFSSHRTSLDSSLHVKPTQILVDFIKANMRFSSSYDSIYFELVEREDGLLVIAKYNSILASRWLALLPLSELLEIRKNATTVYKEKAK